MNAYEVENLMRSWLMAVAYTTPHKIANLDLRIDSAGCDVRDGDFMALRVSALDESNPVAINVHKPEASVRFTGLHLSSAQLGEISGALMRYWDRIK